MSSVLFAPVADCLERFSERKRKSDCMFALQRCPYPSDVLALALTKAAVWFIHLCVLS